MKRQQQGFTLIEIAIVLVIIGLLLGGVLKGQELITSARVRNLISQQDGVKAAFFGFQDRFRALPGDYATASTNLKCGSGNCLNGNGNGQIQANATPVSGSEVHEEILAWSHLTAANFLNGSYNMTAGDTSQTDANSPKNPYSIYMQLVYDANYADSTAATNKHNLKTGSQVPVEILAEVDRKIDDGNPLQGGFRFSPFVPNGGTALPAPAATYSAGVCASTAGTWFSTNSETNCGGASLF
jgi:prepilin-type N-terminal cleavage/methylation domain-containing protein